MSALKSAFRKDHALLEEMRSVPSNPNRCDVWWLGQSGFLLHHVGIYFLFDPYLSDSLTEKYATTDKPHERVSERVLEPSELTMVQFVTGSHLHTDHLDAATLQPLARATGGYELFVPVPIIALAETRAQNPLVTVTGIDEWTTVERPGFQLRGITAAHNEIVRNEHGQSHFLGFLLRLGPFTIYHSGDTLWHSELVPQLVSAKVDLALVPINGNKPERRVAGNLNPVEAAALAKAIGAGLAVPHHYDLFAFNTGDPKEFAAACEALSQPCQVMELGERLVLRKDASSL
jgi:L-ascorbate metabolism protein UlaG (beta-lactamase superfamily)